MRKFLFLLLLLISTLSTFSQPGRRHFDPQNPDVHDPVMARGEDGRYYIFYTGMRVGVISSADLKEWRRETPVFDQVPQWAMDSVPGYRGHTWAPDISYHNGLWYLYYSCSTFGKNGSAIGLAVNKTLDPTSPDFHWQDRGVVIVSHQKKDHWNAIDPNLVVDDQGNPWLTFGSFWDGIQLMRLSRKDYQTPVTKPVTIARRYKKKKENPVEAPFIIHHGGNYYLFVSFDYCCRGEKSTYKTVYGRSKTIEGPYLDMEGKPMKDGGGTLLYGPDEENYGIGHCSVYDINDTLLFVSHAYKKQFHGRSKLFIRKIKL